jgi:hypothetical protein
MSAPDQKRPPTVRPGVTYTSCRPVRRGLFDRPASRTLIVEQSAAGDGNIKVWIFDEQSSTRFPLFLDSTQARHLAGEMNVRADLVEDHTETPPDRSTDAGTDDEEAR